MPARVVVIIPRLARLALPTTRARGRASNTALAFAACILVVRRRVTRTRVPRRSRLVIGDRPPPHPRRRCRWMGTGGPSREGARGGDYATGHDPSRGDRSPRPTTRPCVMCGSGPCVLYRDTRSVSMYYYFVFSRACVGARTPVMRSMGRDGPVRTVVGVKPIYVWVGRSVASIERSVGRSVAPSTAHARARRPTDRSTARDGRSRTPRATDDDDDDVSSSTDARDRRARPTDVRDRRGRRPRGPTRGVHGASRGGGAEGHVRESEIVARATIAGGFGESSRRSGVDSVNRRVGVEDVWCGGGGCFLTSRAKRAYEERAGGEGP